MPPKLRNQAKPENSNQPTLFQQWRFRTKPSHPSESPNVRCEKLFLQLWRTVIHWDNIAGFMKYIRYIGRGPGIKTGFCSDKAILRRYVITLFENTLFCYEIIEDISSALRHFYDKGNRFYQPHYYL